MKTLFALFTFWLLSGCSSLPSMKYCDEVSYLRKGSQIEIHALCQAPVGGAL